jgi:4-hydroxybenzoate polyprenyltransferase
MAGARAVDVLGGTESIAPALPAALVVGMHTYTVAALSRHEIDGASASLPAATLAGSTAVGLTAAALPTGRVRRLAAAVGVLGYLGTYGVAQLRTVRAPSARNIQGSVSAGILGLMPLQAALTAGRGAMAPAVALAAAHPVARRLARRVSPT